VPLALLFAWTALRAPTPMAALGAAILAVWALVVLVLYLSVSRGRTDSGLPVRLAIESEVGRLRALERFARNAKWYRAVLAAGGLLYAFGVAMAMDDRSARLGTIAFMVLVLLAVEGMIFARRRRPSRTRALQEDLESWLAGLDALEADTLEGR
jgi:ABC-type transport system involved in cytochrome c biogenesis permease subunit